MRGVTWRVVLLVVLNTAQSFTPDGEEALGRHTHQHDGETDNRIQHSADGAVTEEPVVEFSDNLTPAEEEESETTENNSTEQEEDEKYTGNIPSYIEVSWKGRGRSTWGIYRVT